MNRLSVLALLNLLLFSTASLGQTTPNDSQTLQALLSEVRQLRQELQTTIIASQRAQILIYRVQGQEAAVERASMRLEEARERLARTEDERKHLASEVKQVEDFIGNNENSVAQRKQFEERLPLIKERLESLDGDKQQNQSREIEAEQLLRTEEARLGDLREQLDGLDKTLENAARKSDTGIK
jgi:chromosome segregation ATPase